MLNAIKSYDELISEINDSINILNIYPQKLSEEKNHKLHLIFDKMLYISLLINDIIIGLKYLDLSVNLNNNVESIYFSKIVALNAYEMLNESGRLTGNKLIKQIFSDINNEDFNSKFKDIKKELYKVKKDCQPKLKVIRNKIIAHKDSNPFDQINTMQKIEFKEIYKIGHNIFNIHLKLLRLFQNLLKVFFNTLLTQKEAG